MTHDCTPSAHLPSYHPLWTPHFVVPFFHLHPCFRVPLFAVAFQVKAPGLHDHVHEFHKPIFTTFLSCLSNAVLGLVAISLAKLRALTARRGWKLVPNSPSAPENPFLPAVWFLPLDTVVDVLY